VAGMCFSKAAASVCRGPLSDGVQAFGLGKAPYELDGRLLWARHSRSACQLSDSRSARDIVGFWQWKAPAGMQPKVRPSFFLFQTPHSTAVRHGELASKVWKTQANRRLSVGQIGVEFIHTECVGSLLKSSQVFESGHDFSRIGGGSFVAKGDCLKPVQAPGFICCSLVIHN
jgi:hypothetical protein